MIRLAMIRLAMIYCSNRAITEEVAQEAWLGVLRGLDRFEGRSSLKTWIFGILTNCAKTRARREGRSIPFSAHWNSVTAPAEPAVDPDRFLPPDDEWAGHWASRPESWANLPEERFIAKETRGQIDAAIAALPPAQREVITRRDLEGWTSDEVSEVLEISEGNQRVLLHRARSKVWRAPEHYFKGT